MSPSRVPVAVLQAAAIAVLLFGAVALVGGLDVLSGSGFGDGASPGEKWIYVTSAGIPPLVCAALLCGLSVIADLLYDQRDGKHPERQLAADPAEQGQVF